MASSRENVELITMHENAKVLELEKEKADFDQKENTYVFEFEKEKANFENLLENLTNFCESDGKKDKSGQAFALIHVKHLKKTGDIIFKTISEKMVEENRSIIVKKLLELDEATKLYNKAFGINRDYAGDFLRAPKIGAYSKMIEIEDQLERIRKNFPKDKREKAGEMLDSIKSLLNVSITERNALNKLVENLYKEEKNKVNLVEENKPKKSCCVIS